MNRNLLTFSCALLFCGAPAQEIFHSIVVQQHDGTCTTFPIDQTASISFTTEPSVQHDKWFHMLENPGIADYLRDFEYDATDGSYHNIFLYRGEPYLDQRQDWPYGVTLGDTTYYNLIPGRTYSLSPVHRGIAEAPVSIQTLGQLRMLRTEGIDNVRDLGGWPTVDGHRLRYGLLYRGTELDTKLTASTARRSAHQATPADLQLMLNDLGIRAELDLRATTEIPNLHSALGDSIAYLNQNISYTELSSVQNRKMLLECLRFIIAQLDAGHPIYIHCVWGADRTGVLCLLLEGLLGLSQSNLDKDYELTSFAGNSRFRNGNRYRSIMDYLQQYEGKTLQQKFHHWWRDSGATDAELAHFIALMTE